MSNNREAGKIILINGASSAGKSTLARQLQRTLPEPFWHFSFDYLRDSNVLPMTRIHSGEIDWPAMRPAVFDGFHRCLPALAEAGNDLIVDHILDRRQSAFAAPSAGWETGENVIRTPARELVQFERIPSEFDTDVFLSCTIVLSLLRFS